MAKLLSEWPIEREIERLVEAELGTLIERVSAQVGPDHRRFFPSLYSNRIGVPQYLTLFAQFYPEASANSDIGIVLTIKLVRGDDSVSCQADLVMDPTGDLLDELEPPPTVGRKAAQADIVQAVDELADFIRRAEQLVIAEIESPGWPV